MLAWDLRKSQTVPAEKRREQENGGEGEAKAESHARWLTVRRYVMLTVPSPSRSTSPKNCGGKMITLHPPSSTLSSHLHSFFFGDTFSREKVYHLHHVHCGLEGHDNISTLSPSLPHLLPHLLPVSQSLQPLHHLLLHTRESTAWRLPAEGVWSVEGMCGGWVSTSENAGRT